MRKKKILLTILAMISLGMYAQEIRYVTVPTAPSTTSASNAYTSTTTTTTQSYQSPYQTSTSYQTIRSNDFGQDTLKTSENKAIRTTFIKNRPQDNWFFSLSGGAAMLQSEESRYRKLADQFDVPTVGFSLGKWWTPVWGLQISAMTAKLHGFAVNTQYGEVDANGDPLGPYFLGSWYNGKNYSNGEGRGGIQNTYTSGTTPSGAQLIADRYLNLNDVIVTPKGTGYSYDVTYAAASIDLMLNLKNYFTRYNPKAAFNPVLYAGVGMAHTFAENSKDGNDDKSAYMSNGRTAVNSIMGKAGLQLNFRLGSAVDFFLDGNTLILPEFFDRRVGDGNTMDLVFNGGIGFTYKFKERYFYEPICGNTQIAPVNAVINTTRNDCCEDIAATLRRIEDILQRQPAPQVVPGPAPTSPSPYTEIEHLKVTVFFVIDKWDVRPSEMYKLDEIARFMAKYPQVRVSITGYADVQTAYPAYNMKLSQRRANEVARLLSTKYGIDRNNLRVSFQGDSVQPFDINEKNRAVIAFDIR